MSTAHDPKSKYMPEHFDDEETLDRKCKKLAKWIKESEHFIVYTGAGISTSCGIPDFRGPEGAWTLKAQGKTRTKKTTSTLKAVPSRCHMALVELANQGDLKYIVSQNCDGLHVRSGIHRNNISELHGNSNLERCDNKKCRKEYLRDFSVRKPLKRGQRRKRLPNGRIDHDTGRKCGLCGSKLNHTTLAFGEYLDTKVLGLAMKNGKRSDLCVVLGSSCTVTPAADIPEEVGEHPLKRLVIVNLQKTPLNESASLVIHGKTDDVMERVTKNLGYQIPKWYLRRKILIRWVDNNNEEEEEGEQEEEQEQKIFVSGLDPNDLTFFEYMKKVTVTVNGGRIKKTSRKTPHCVKIPFKKTSRKDVALLSINLEFFQHYYEPNIKFRIKKPEDKDYVVCNLSYDVNTRKWKIHKDKSGNDDLMVQRKMKKFRGFLDQLR